MKKLFILVLVLACLPVAVSASMQPSVEIRQESLGENVYRLVFSARADTGVNMFGIVFSFDNARVVPVNHTNRQLVHNPASPAANRALPFRTMMQCRVGVPVQNVAHEWATRGGRTAFYVVRALGYGSPGTTANVLSDIFAFYFTIAGEVLPDTFFIEDGTNPIDFRDLLPVSYGISLSDGRTTFTYGEAVDTGNTPLAGGQVALPTPFEISPSFEAYLRVNHIEHSYPLTRADVRNITRIDAAGVVNDFTGIQHLPSLRYLLAQHNRGLTHLDVSHNRELRNLVVQGSGIETLIIGDLPYLRHINASGNNLRSLQLGYLPSLTGLSIAGNGLAVPPNLTRTPALRIFWAENNSLLGMLDIRNNNNLRVLDLRGNPMGSGSVLGLEDHFGMDWQNNHQYVPEENLQPWQRRPRLASGAAFSNPPLPIKRDCNEIIKPWDFAPYALI